MANPRPPAIPATPAASVLDSRAADVQAIRALLERPDGSHRASILLDRDRAERLLVALTAPTTPPDAATSREVDLAALIGRLVHALAPVASAATLRTQALTLLRTYHLLPGPLRGPDGSSRPSRPPPPVSLDPVNRVSAEDAPAEDAAAGRSVERPTGMDGWWPHGVHRAFVDGAKWWQFHQNGSTMFGAERDEAEAKALEKYGPVPGDPEA